MLAMMARPCPVAIALIVFFFVGVVHPFAPTGRRWFPAHLQATALKSEETSSSSSASATAGETLNVPLSWEEMVRQAATAMKMAARDGKTRQIVRILLPRESVSGDLGQLVEPAALDLKRAVLVPPDESWQGGILQLYRSAAPTCTAILRQMGSSEGGLPARVEEDRSVDESGVDGIGLFQTDDNSIMCWLQPTQEISDALLRSAEKAAADKLVVLMNPQWRTVSDALDTVSEGEGFFAGLASFLGGKGGVVKQLTEQGFVSSYTLEGYVCRGTNVRLMQSYGSDWAVFCERDDGESYFPIGNAPSRPTYQDVEKMLDASGVGYKYARDMGFEDRL